MRSLLARYLAIALLPSLATAAPSGGGGRDSGGRLGSVTAGVSRSVDNDRSSDHAGHQFDDDPRTEEGEGTCVTYTGYTECENPMFTRRIVGNQVTVMRTADRSVVRQYEVPPPRPASFDFFLGAQDVYDSAGAINLSAAARDGAFRIAGTLAHYWEDTMAGRDERATLTMPTLTLGLALPATGARIHADAGVVYLRTHHPTTGSESLTGAIMGLHIDAPLASIAEVTASARVMGFGSEVSAWDARIGVRLRHVEAGFRILDFNTGPALYGPELGVTF